MSNLDVYKRQIYDYDEEEEEEELEFEDDEDESMDNDSVMDRKQPSKAEDESDELEEDVKLEKS